MSDLEVVCKALDFLGLSYIKNGKCRMWDDKSITAPIVITLPDFDIAVKPKGEILELVADSMAYEYLHRLPIVSKFIKPYEYVTQKRFSEILQQSYNVVKAVAVAAEMGHSIYIGMPDESGVISAQVVTGHA